MSETRGNYAIMLDALADDLPEIEKRIFEALKKHPGGLLRQQLVAIAYGESVRAGAIANNNSRDRAVRMAIQNLRMRMVPIVASSRAAGYRLDTSEEGRQLILQELISRRNRLNYLIELAAKFYQAPETMPAAEAATQARLI